MMSRFLLLVAGGLALAVSPALCQAAPPARSRLVRPSAPVARPTRPTAPADSLTQLITRLDAQAFAAYNAHDVDGLMAFFAPDVEFFHDTGGLSTFSQTRQGFASVFAHNADIHRELVPGSLEVYPIKKYGAIQVGAHRFCHTENGRLDCGTFKFVMVWQRQPGGWRITRVVSYGH